MIDLDNNDFPISIESKRLVLRKLRKMDIADIYEIYSDEESSRYDDWEPMKDISRAEMLIANSIKYFHNKEALRYAIEPKLLNKVIGVACIYEFEELNNKCIIYFQINRKEWNKGYASEAVHELIYYAFETLQVNRIEAYVTPGNEESLNVLLKIGFVKEGLMREMEYYKGKYQDAIILGMIKKDWDSQKKIKEAKQKQ